MASLESVLEFHVPNLHLTLSVYLYLSPLSFQSPSLALSSSPSSLPHLNNFDETRNLFENCLGLLPSHSSWYPRAKPFAQHEFSLFNCQPISRECLTSSLFAVHRAKVLRSDMTTTTTAATTTNERRKRTTNTRAIQWRPISVVDTSKLSCGVVSDGLRGTREITTA